MTIDDILERHASEAAFLWSLREAAASAPHYDLEDLFALDQRVEAHIDGLRLSGDAAWKKCKAALETEEPGEVFVATAMATDRLDLKGIALVLDVAGGVPELQHAIVSGLAWIAFESVRRILPGLLAPACPPELHLLGIAACVAHGANPGPPLENALYSDDTALRACALRAVGDLGQQSLVRLLKLHLASVDAECRFSAAWSLGLRGDVDAVSVLQELARSDCPRSAEACALAVRRLAPKTASAWLRSWMNASGALRLAVEGAGHAGDPELVPWLLQCMEVPELARVAGESFTLITGVDLARERLSRPMPEGQGAGPTDDPDDDDVAMDPDENLPWPDAALVSRWWSGHRRRFTVGERHLLGKPPDAIWCRRILRHGSQRQRLAAAIELARIEPSQPLFPVRAPAFRQRQLLG